MLHSNFFSIFDDKTRFWSLVSLTIVVISNIIILFASNSLESSCSPHKKIIIAFYILPLPIWLLFQLSILRAYHNTLEYVDKLFHLICSIIISFFSTLICLIIFIQSWSCSTISLQFSYLTSIFVSLIVCIVSIRSFWCTFIFTTDNQAKQSLLLLVRCWCLTRRFKKFLLVSPYFILALYIMIHVSLHWNSHCTLPFQSYSLVSSFTLLLMGFAALMLLNYGRRRIHLNEASEQVMESIHQINPLHSHHLHLHHHPLPLPNQTQNQSIKYHSTTASDVITLAKESQRCISLSVLWYFAGGINLFAFVWGILGEYWSEYEEKCPHDLIRIFKICEIFLIILSTLGMVTAWILKVESCFPTVLDPSHFHSNRTGHRHPPQSDRLGESSPSEIRNTQPSSLTMDSGLLDDSDTSLLHNSTGDGILNHQYGKVSKFLSHVDIEINNLAVAKLRRQQHDFEIKNMNIGESKTNFSTSKRLTSAASSAASLLPSSLSSSSSSSTSPSYSRLPV